MQITSLVEARRQEDQVVVTSHVEPSILKDNNGRLGSRSARVVRIKGNGKVGVKVVAKQILKAKKNDARTSSQPRLSEVVQAMMSDLHYVDISNRPAKVGSKLGKGNRVQ
ncbi:hypothetical protein V6N13_148325 [Hibiscus sabdariffa]